MTAGTLALGAGLTLGIGYLTSGCDSDGSEETCKDYCVQIFECISADKGGQPTENDWKKCLENCERYQLNGTGYYPQCE